MREVLVHLNVEVADGLSNELAKKVAVVEVINAARESNAAFEAFIALVDPT